MFNDPVLTNKQILMNLMRDPLESAKDDLSNIDLYDESPQMKVGDHIWNDRVKTTDQLLRA